MKLVEFKVDRDTASSIGAIDDEETSSFVLIFEK
jgi:hypothetical protein